MTSTGTNNLSSTGRATAEALAWAADVVHAEARWQWELHERGGVGAQIVAQRMTVVEKVLRSAAAKAAEVAS